MNRITKVLATIITAVLLFSNIPQTFAQSDWEGTFMEQFRVQLSFDGLGTGTIKMYDGAAEIQHDGLIKVVIKESEITFNIPAKQTEFKGRLNQAGQQISGNFVFPDGSLQPLVVNKVMASEDNAMVISRTEAAADLSQLYMAIKETHPEPFKYISAVEFDKLFSTVSRIENENISIQEFYLKTAKLSDGVRCSHTGLRLPAEILAGIKHVFPLEVFYDNENLYVLESPAEDIPAGSVIAKINGVPTPEILAQLKLLVPVNGLNTTTKACIINRKFSTMLPLIDNAAEYRLEFRNEGRQELIIPATAKSPASEPTDLIIFEPGSQ